MPCAEVAEDTFGFEGRLGGGDFADECIGILIFPLTDEERGLGDALAILGFQAQQFLLVLGCAFPEEKPGGTAKAGEQSEQNCGPSCENSAVAANKFLEAIKPAGRAGADGLVVQEALD